MKQRNKRAQSPRTPSDSELPEVRGPAARWHLRSRRRSCHPSSGWGLRLLLVGLVVALAMPATAADDDEEFDWESKGYRDPYAFRDDIVVAVDLVGSDQIFVVGEFGLIGVLTPKGDLAELALIEHETREDMVSAVALDDGSALFGSAGGKIFRYADGQVEELAHIHEHNDSVLALGVQRGAGGKVETVWAAGARGLVAKSTDFGKTWTNAAPEKVVQPPIPIPDTAAGTWVLGVANLVEGSLVIDAKSGGKPLEAGRDYEVTLEDGYLDLKVPLDAEPQPMISYEFAPGPPFQAGDFTMSVVLSEADTVTLAGEFGMIWQTRDGGASWIRQNGSVSREDPETPYWINGAIRGDSLLLVGAAGAVARSDDGGVTWTQLTRPSEGGVFGAYVGEDDTLVIGGAVGLLAEYNGTNWKVADRSRLSVYSWVKNLLAREDGSLIGLGGRGNCVYRENGDWERCRVRLVEQKG